MTHICAQCGEKFEADPRRNRIYCSAKCYFDSRRKNPKRIKVCEYCKKEYVAERKERRFCSISCGAKNRHPNKKHKAKKVAKPKPRPRPEPKPTRTCVGCKYYLRSREYYCTVKIGHRCFECTNASSEYYGAFLNIDENGNITKDVWPGCDKWTGQKVAV